MERFFKHVTASALAVLLGVFAVGCDGFSSLSDENAERGAFTLLLTDAPFPFELVSEANVWIDSVDIVSDDDGVRTLTSFDPAEKFNLLELQNGVTTPLFEGDLEANTYSQIRLYVSSASIVLIDDQTFDLKVPSNRVKVLLADLTVEGGVDTELTLDFDVSESFVVQGNPDTPAGIHGFLFKPVVKPINMKSSAADDQHSAEEAEDDGQGEGEGEVEGNDEAEGEEEGEENAEENEDEAEGEDAEEEAEEETEDDDAEVDTDGEGDLTEG